MKKYYCITIITILVISILHGYNIYLEYKDYTAKKIESISSTFKVSVDEERAKRAYKKHKNHKDGKQRAYYKIMSDAELRKAHPAPKDILTLDEINISDLRAKGIAETEDEAFGLLAQDLLAKKGRPFNLVQLSRIFKKNIKEEFSYTLFILDKKKKIIKIWPNTWDRKLENEQAYSYRTKSCKIRPSENRHTTFNFYPKFDSHTRTHIVTCTTCHPLRRLPNDSH